MDSQMSTSYESRAEATFFHRLSSQSDPPKPRVLPGGSSVGVMVRSLLWGLGGGWRGTLWRLDSDQVCVICGNVTDDFSPG